jgi:hypothetical protein
MVRDLGDGQRLEIAWNANPETDITGYRVYWTLQSGSYPDSILTSHICDTLTGLHDDSLYYIIVRAVDADGHPSPLAYEAAGRPDRWIRLADGQEPLPSFWFQPNRPNPFVSQTSFEYHLPAASRVTIKIYDDTGLQMSTLVDQFQEPGPHAVTWNGKDEDGRPVASGVYFYTFRHGEEQVTGQLVFTK